MGKKSTKNYDSKDHGEKFIRYLNRLDSSKYRITKKRKSIVIKIIAHPKIFYKGVWKHPAQSYHYKNNQIWFCNEFLAKYPV